MAFFEEGKSITEIVEMGYKQATVYRYHRFYKMEKEKEKITLLIDESERIKKVFNAFSDGEKLIDVVRKHGISPAQVKELHDSYVELGEIEAGMGEKLDRINEMLERKHVLEAENEALEANQVKIRASINELYEGYERRSITDYIKLRDEYLSIILDSKMPETDYSGEERERVLIQRCREALCHLEVPSQG